MIASKHDDEDHDHTHEHGPCCGHEHAQPASTTSANLLLVSVGNTRLAIASFINGRRGMAQHFALDQMDQAADELRNLWAALPANGKRAVVVSSVNPPQLDAFRQACDARKIAPLLVVGEDLEPPMPADVDEPDRVGVDRLCAAAAAFETMKSACTVADFGTAVTVDLIADNGVFLGGAILPGIALSARALHEHTASLPLVDMTGARLGEEMLGKNTNDAISGGILSMMAGALREITERYAVQIGKWPPLIVTGGDAETIAATCNFVDRVVPDLGLDGLTLAYRRAFEPEES